MNTFGTYFRLTTFGESHGPAIGGVIDGVPPGLRLDSELVQRQLDRRRPGQSAITTQRHEADRVELLSGISPDGLTLGSPIGFLIRNTDQRPADYSAMAEVYRPGHADYTTVARYGLRDHRGGGRASARETACRVVGGAVASQLLARRGVTVTAFTSSVGPLDLDPATEITAEAIEASAVRCPDPAASARMVELIEHSRSQADSIGGTVECRVSGLEAGVGTPLFGKLTAMLASALMSIPAARGVEFGMGFDGCRLPGSATVDQWADGFTPLTNHSGGLQGGMSNGAELRMRVAFKAVATLARPLQASTADGHAVSFTATGRHDPCVLPRAVPVVEAMVAMTLVDAIMEKISTTQW